MNTVIRAHHEKLIKTCQNNYTIIPDATKYHELTMERAASRNRKKVMCHMLKKLHSSALFQHKIRMGVPGDRRAC